jgi:hypothetical protein
MISHKSVFAIVLLTALTLAGCGSSSSTGGDDGLACRNYKRTTLKHAQTIVDWTSQLATADDVAKSFAALADASQDNATFVSGDALTVFSSATTAWRAARVAVLSGSGFADQVTAAVTADGDVRDFCASIGEVIP